jgi:Holliday junction resolvase RusA-like endonuclease
MNVPVSFVVPGKPVGKGRPRAGRSFAGHVRLYTPEKTVSYESTVRLFGAQAMAGRSPIEGPVSLEMLIEYDVPASWSKKKRDAALAGDIRPTAKPDCDNVVKAIGDALNGVVWKDDVQVVELRAEKRYAAAPGVYVCVKEMA